MGNSVKKNYIYSLLYKIITCVIPLATTYHIARALGVDGVGKVSYVESVVGYFVLFANLGIALHGSKIISYYQDDITQRSIQFWETKIIQIVTSLISLTVYLLFVFQRKEVLYIVFSINIISVLVDINWLYQGMEDFKSIVIRNLIIKLTYCFSIFIFIDNRNDLALFGLLTVLSTLLGNISLLTTAKKYVVFIPVKQLKPIRQLKSILSLFLPTIATQIYAIFDKSFLGAITVDKIQNGYYQQANIIIIAALSIVTVLGTVMMPRIGFYYKKGYNEKIKQLVYKGFRFVLFSSIPICTGICAIAEMLVPIYLGDEYLGSTLPLRILALTIIFIGLSNYIGLQYLIPTGQQKNLTISVAIGAITNILLDLLLIPQYFAVGAAIATAIAEFAVVTFQFYSIRKQISLVHVIGQAKKYFISGTIMCVVVYFMGKYMETSLINMLLCIMTGILIYIFLLTIFRDSLYISCIHTITKKVIKKHQKF